MTENIRYSLGEITAALGGLDEGSRQMVFDALSKQAADRQAERLEPDRMTDIVRFAAIYERTSGENASDSHIESWFELLSEQSRQLLESFAERPAGTALEEMTRDAAAVTYTFLKIEDEAAPEAVELAERAGIEPGDLLAWFRSGIIDSSVNAGDDRGIVTPIVEATFEHFIDFHHKLTTEDWRPIVGRRAMAVRAALLLDGVVLPELNEAGRYGETDSLEV